MKSHTLSAIHLYGGTAVEYWQEFQQLSYANELLMGIGGVTVLWSVFRIIRSSMTMIFWVLLAGIGSASLSYGMNKSSLDLPWLDKLEEVNVTDIFDTQKEISADVLRVMCTKLDEAGQVSQ